MSVDFEDGYIPKKDTQQEDFLEEFPKYDGRNTVIGVIDSGVVDFSSPGMQTTTDGRPKIIDCFSIFEEGHIDMSTIREIPETETDAKFVTLSGKKFKIPLHWKNPSRKWHLGKMSLEKFCRIFMMNPFSMKTRDIVVDCIVWFDGEKWRAVVDTSFFFGNLESLKVLTNFADEHEYSFLDGKKFVPYCVKIENDGNQLQIIVPLPFGKHGNSVAHTAVAHFPNEPEQNGLAPGAQIISINIQGNCAKRHSFIKKALSMLIGSVDIINMSHDICDVPEIAQIIEEIVEKHGIIVTVSAGNAGPSFTSIKTLPSSLYVIGSVLTNDINQRLQKTEELCDFLPEVFSYSSRGPSSETYARGIDFVAPGAVVTPNLKGRNELHFGTSFAAPIAAGLIACLISGLKANSIQYSPAKIRLALSNTALIPKNGNGLEFGNGIIQIKDAFQFFNKNLTNISSVESVLLKNTKTGKLGIFYIHEEENHPNCTKFNFELNPSPKKSIKWDLEVVSNSTTSFIEYSETIKDDNLLSIQIDPTLAKPGILNYAEIRGFDSSMPSLGPLFHLPITVIIPQKVTKKEKFCIQKTIELSSCSCFSFFFYPPYASTQCTFKFTVLEAFYFAEIYFKCNQIIFDPIEFTSKKRIQTLTFPIHWEEMLEICVFRQFEHINYIDVLRFTMDVTFNKKKLNR